MPGSKQLLLLLGAAALVVAVSSPARAAITREQRAAAGKIQELLRDVNRLVRGKELDDASKTLGEARQELAKLASTGEPDELRGLIVPLQKRFEAVEQLLKSKQGTPGGGTTEGPSFSNDVAPILLARCGNCHVQRNRGNFSMASYAALAQGADGSPVIDAGRSASSRIVEVIESGDMPRGGGRVAVEELATLSKWIDAGATFDGDDPATPLGQLAPPGSTPGAPPAAALAVARPTGKETISYSRDVAPVLVAECVGCHGANQASGQLGFDTFDRLLRGGQSGAIVVPGKPDDSLLVQKLRGQAGAQMPLRRPPLADDVIAKFAIWIAEGATFDGPEPGQSTADVAEIYLVERMPHEELAVRRAERGMKNWQLAIPDEAPTRHETNQFLLLGDLPAEQMAALGATAEADAEKLSKFVGHAQGEPLIKGRLTLFLFARRFDYTEFAQMVEDREAESSEHGHWRYNVMDAYACLQLPRNADPAASSTALVEQIAGAYVDHLADVPYWFSRGSALALAAQLAPHGSEKKALDEAARAARGKVTNPDAFLAGNIVPADVDPLCYGFVSFLLSAPDRYRALLAALREGEKFDDALERHYGRDAKELVALWRPS